MAIGETTYRNKERQTGYEASKNEKKIFRKRITTAPPRSVTPAPRHQKHLDRRDCEMGTAVARVVVRHCCLVQLFTFQLSRKRGKGGRGAAWCAVCERRASARGRGLQKLLLAVMVCTRQYWMTACARTAARLGKCGRADMGGMCRRSQRGVCAVGEDVWSRRVAAALDHLGSHARMFWVRAAVTCSGPGSHGEWAEKVQVQNGCE